MVRTASKLTNALRHAWRFECVVERSFTPITGLLAGNRFLRIYAPAGISTAPSDASHPCARA